MSAISQNLRMLRGETFQKEIAAIIGTSQSTYSLYEKGVREPSLAATCVLADYYHVSVDSLIGHHTGVQNAANESKLNVPEQDRILDQCTKEIDALRQRLTTVENLVNNIHSHGLKEGKNHA